MKKTFLLTLIICFSLNYSFAQKTLNGVKLPAKLGFAGTVRDFVGGGVRTEFFVRAYVLGLYMKEKTTDPKEIINADKPMSVRLQMTSALLTSKLMEEKIREGFSKSLNGKIEPYEEMIDLICGIFSSEPTKVGDVYDIHYTPGVGVSASKNSIPYDFKKYSESTNSTIKNSEKLKKIVQDLKYTTQGQSAIPSLGFKKALFGIWFSDNPVDSNLKADVLGIK